MPRLQEDASSAVEVLKRLSLADDGRQQPSVMKSAIKQSLASAEGWGPHVVPGTVV